MEPLPLKYNIIHFGNKIEVLLASLTHPTLTNSEHIFGDGGVMLNLRLPARIYKIFMTLTIDFLCEPNFSLLTLSCFI
jgi:hypothetical protein